MPNVFWHNGDDAADSIGFYVAIPFFSKELMDIVPTNVMVALARARRRCGNNAKWR